MSAQAIIAQSVSKAYRLGAPDKKHDSLSAAVIDRLKSPLRRLRSLRGLSTAGRDANPDDTFWALRDVSFDIARGSVVGIIGDNGAGKSTLLKILSRVTEPSAGRITLRGRVGSLLEVGTGFHPELTGRENIYMNGTILGMSRREIGRKFAEIVEFSGVEAFLDTPVKRYSTGMKVRLGFAVAAHLNPEILIVDEVLAVGDYQFQKRCLGKMESVTRESDRTVLMVSHQLGMMRSLCQRGIVLKSGSLAYDGPIEDAIAHYVGDTQNESLDSFVQFEPNPDSALELLHAELLDSEGRPQPSVNLFCPASVRLCYRVRKSIQGSNLAAVLLSKGSPLFATFDTDLAPQFLEERLPGTYEAIFGLPVDVLKAGYYRIRFDCGLVNGSHMFHKPTQMLGFTIEEDHDTSLKSYSLNRQPLVACRVRWSTRTLEQHGKPASKRPEERLVSA